MRATRRFVVAGACAALLALVAVVLDYVLVTPERVAAALMSPGGTIPDGAPEPDAWGLPAEPFTVRTEDGVALRGWYVPAATSAQATVLVCHGVGTSHWGAMGLASTLHATGSLAVVLFDFRGHGASEHAPYTYGAHEVRDVRAIVTWTRARSGDAPISIVGWSAGAATSLLYAAEDPSIERVVAINPFASMREMAAYRRPFFVREQVYADALALVEQRADFRIDDVSPIDAAPRVRAAVLVMVGEADTTVPPTHGRRLSAALGAGATLWSLPGIGHDDWWAHPEFDARLISFLTE